MNIVKYYFELQKPLSNAEAGRQFNQKHGTKYKSQDFNDFKNGRASTPKRVIRAMQSEVIDQALKDCKGNGKKLLEMIMPVERD